MRRITLIAITAVSTLVATAGISASVFTVGFARGGVLIMSDAQAAECTGGGGCWLMSARQVQAAAEEALREMLLKQRGPSI